MISSFFLNYGALVFYMFPNPFELALFKGVVLPVPVAFFCPLAISCASMLQTLSE